MTIIETPVDEKTKTKKAIHYCVISHTHWDREWYLPFEEFRIRLVDLVDHLFEIFDQYPNYIFHLDAQTIVLEDYLQIRPYRDEALKRLIQSGRLLVGPWYVQNDFFLTSGEATIRNLLLGTSMAEQFGRCSRVGYVPDQFGLISQLPQIFEGFGLRHCVMGRGLHQFEKDKSGRLLRKQDNNEFEWQGADGTKVLGILMRDWYNNAQRFPADETRAARYLHMIDRQLRPNCTTPFYMLMNGVDHLEAQEDLLPILEKLNENMEDAQIYQTSMENYLMNIEEELDSKQIQCVCGELRHGTDWSILQGTLSSRAYLKKANVVAQSMIENMIEPLYSTLGFLGKPQLYPQDFLTYLWKCLIKQHPHDNICGCSRDQVHSHMEDFFERLMECGQSILARGMKAICEHIDKTEYNANQYILIIYNTLMGERDGLIKAEVYFPAEDEIEKFKLFDVDGNEVFFELIDKAQAKKSMFTPINLPGEKLFDCYAIQFLAKKINGLGYKTYRIDPLSEGPAIEPVSAAVNQNNMQQGYVLENEYLKIDVSDMGQVDLKDKEHGHTFRDIISLQDQADLGHSYVFIADPDGIPIVPRPGQVHVRFLENSFLMQSLEIQYALELPTHYDFDLKQRSEQTVVNMVCLRLNLARGSRCLQMEISVDNQSKDHRLRILFHSDIQSDYSSSLTPFDLVRRNRREILSNMFKEKSQPNSGLIFVHDAQRSLSIYNEGLFEYEHLGNERQTLALTLVRATGFISEHDEPVPPSKEWLVPGNQSIRRTNFRLGLKPGGSDVEDVIGAYQDFAVPLLHHFDAIDMRKLSGGRSCVQDTELQEIFYRPLPKGEASFASEGSPLKITGNNVVFSAFKKAERGEMFVLRLFNSGEYETTANIEFMTSVRQACVLSLEEKIQTQLRVCERRITISLPPKKILTLGLLQ